MIPYAWLRPLLFRLDPETAHDLTLGALARLQHTPLVRLVGAPRIADPVTLAGLTFPNRVGLAAGLDKNGRCIDGFAACGFGFIEVGTVTPLAQAGNPKPRMFRLPAAQALINRMGFNNDGLAAFVAQVRRARFRQDGGILGLNIGKNAATPLAQAADDYLTCLDGVYPHADYVAINVSSPNTAGLRGLQEDAALAALLDALQRRRAALAVEHGRRVPLFLKIAPDLDRAQTAAIAAAVSRHGIEGVIATNTTTARTAVAHLPHASETGGLSGKPVFHAANRVVAQLRATLGRDVPIVAAGGVMRPADALAKVAAGADLVQLYTGLIFTGPGLVPAVAAALKR